MKTLVNARLVNFETDEHGRKIAKTIDDAKTLVEQGFEYVTEVERMKLFREPK